MNLPDSERVLASAVRYLIDGNQHDLANVLLSCTLRADSVTEYLQGGYGVIYSLVGPVPFMTFLAK
jgi:hypothetical protein